MRPEQWDIFRRAARRQKLDKVPMALIVDSPWIPGYLGIKHMDDWSRQHKWGLVLETIHYTLERS